METPGDRNVTLVGELGPLVLESTRFATNACFVHTLTELTNEKEKNCHTHTHTIFYNNERNQQ